jgi:hypothetical protein
MHGGDGNVDCVGSFQRGSGCGRGKQAARESARTEKSRESKSEGRAVAEARREPVKLALNRDDRDTVRRKCGMHKRDEQGY